MNVTTLDKILTNDQVNAALRAIASSPTANGTTHSLREYLFTIEEDLRKVGVIPAYLTYVLHDRLLQHILSYPAEDVLSFAAFSHCLDLLMKSKSTKESVDSIESYLFKVRSQMNLAKEDVTISACALTAKANLYITMLQLIPDIVPTAVLASLGSTIAGDSDEKLIKIAQETLEGYCTEMESGPLTVKLFSYLVLKVMRDHRSAVTNN